MDKWKVDVAVTGSQKALSLPTGLAVVAVSDKVCTVMLQPTTKGSFRSLLLSQCQSMQMLPCFSPKLQGLHCNITGLLRFLPTGLAFTAVSDKHPTLLQCQDTVSLGLQHCNLFGSACAV